MHHKTTQLIKWVAGQLNDALSTIPSPDADSPILIKLSMACLMRRLADDLEAGVFARQATDSIITPTKQIVH